MKSISNSIIKTLTCLIIAFILFYCNSLKAQINDSCSHAITINIPNNGFGIGTVFSDTISIGSATVEAGETFAPAIFVAGQYRKSIWYKFTIPTNRSVRVTLAQNGSPIAAGDAGFAVYKTTNCLPAVSEISNKLTPIGLFGSTFHPCVESGEYLIQVSSKLSANGPVFIELTTNYSTSAYDLQADAYNFGVLNQGCAVAEYEVDCQSTDNANEQCSTFSNPGDYNKSTWHVFTTPNYFDYISFTLTHLNSAFNTATGYVLYQGDVRTTPYTSLPIIDGCDSLQNTSYFTAFRNYKCDSLNTNTTYSIQLFHHKDFIDRIRVALLLGGTNPTQAPVPIASQIPISNTLGVLPSSGAGITTSSTDYFGCNAHHNLNTCLPAIPDSGLQINGEVYKLSTFFTFTLSGASNVSINSYNECWNNLHVRLFKTNAGIDCSNLDSAHLISGFNVNKVLNCLDPGDYVLQILGVDTFNSSYPYYSYYNFYNNNSNPCLYRNLGSKINLDINVKNINAINHYSLNQPGAFDSTNVISGVMQPLDYGVAYASNYDTFGCTKTVLPIDTACTPINTRAIYREFKVADSSVASILVNGEDYYYNNYYNKLYLGNADSLGTAQSVFNYPDRISGLTPITECRNYNYYCFGDRVCIVPGTYTLATFGNDGHVGKYSYSSIQLDTVNTHFDSPSHVDELGDIVAITTSGGLVTSAIDQFSCKDNAIEINGYQPCNIYGDTATKAIYRTFYLSAPSSVTITNYQTDGCSYYYLSGSATLFSGRISDSINGLTPVTGFQCFSSNSTGNCGVLSAGWYTIISYGSGPTYENPFQNLNQGAYGSSIAIKNYVTITVSVQCEGPAYNRPYKASIDTNTNQPYLIEWGPQTGHTNAYPNTNKLYTLNTEHFNCTTDTPFNLHPILPCDASSVKVAFYVFQTTQESYLQINTANFFGALYKLDVRTDSMLLTSATPIQPCISSYGNIQICRAEPGVYTLAVFGNNTHTCTTVTPTIYIDKIGYSRFDHAKKAYDFGVVPPDSIYHFGKVGDVNPLDAGREPSNDFFYCTTGAQNSDPTDNACGVVYTPSIYNVGTNNNLYTQTNQPSYSEIPRRNLWYTFVVNQGGYVRIKVQNKSIGKQYQYRYAVYESDVNAALPFSSVISTNQLDSTIAQGLTFKVQNASYYYCHSAPSEVSFYRDPCNATAKRYYILVDNGNSYPYEITGMTPNSQVEIGILIDSINPVNPRFDHYYQSSNMGTNLSPGTYIGQRDDFTCATRDLPDPVNYYYNSCSNKTLWYKFSTNITGHVRFRVNLNGNYSADQQYIQLFRQRIAGDSTSNGLVYQSQVSNFYDNGSSWLQTCVNAGTYYIILTGCNLLNEYAIPEIMLVEDLGDFCSAPMPLALPGPGSAVSSVLVDCHTIGTDYGEFNETLTCPQGENRIDYKTSWFKIDITGTDTLDITTYLTENTTTTSSQIKYRLMNGNCGAMQERSCVQDALTQDTYKCLAPGSYYIQVFTPVDYFGQQVTGTIDLHVSGVVHRDTCAPIQSCLANANFLPEFDCNTNDSAIFVNYSTYGSNVQYLWDFGYAGQTSTLVAPKFRYPALATDQTYNVKLVVRNNGCGGKDSSIVPILIPARPNLNLGPDKISCTGAAVILNATSWNGATYLWQDGSTNATFNATAIDVNYYNVEVGFNGCIRKDTIMVSISPIVPKKENYILCANDSILLDSYRGFGETYLWNNNATTSSIYGYNPGLFTNRLKWNTCFILDTFKISAPKSPFAHIDTTICFPFQSFSLDVTTPNAISYTWNDGSTGASHSFPASGINWVNINYGNCSRRDTFNVFVAPAPVTITNNVKICQGNNYTLPWGTQVNIPGNYRDTLRNTKGCDSLIKSYNLSVQNAINVIINATFCTDSTFTLPWGTVVHVPGIYRDTLHYTTGCDSVRRTVNLTEQTFITNVLNPIICISDTYTLPWGALANATGVYRDTLRYTTGCDSFRRIVNLTVQSFTTQVTNPIICIGQTYTLPWGTIVNTTGTYRDTLHYTTGCDSVRRTVNLLVQPFTDVTINATFCTDSIFTLPWGSVVHVPGIYRDTLHYTTGCDSVRRTVNLVEQTFSTNVLNPIICIGDMYTLPWGVVVNSSGTYRDTLRYTTGCDSLRRVVNLTVHSFTTQVTNPIICIGQTYTLPWGTIVNTTGTYRDTLHYTTGCDSVRRTVNLLVQPFTDVTINATFCTDSIFTLPWGSVVHVPGIYRDTLHYTTGCDSVRRTVNLVEQTFSTNVLNPIICIGDTYTLPWGALANATGVYRDTLRYTTGCDSLRRVVNLTVQSYSVQTQYDTICSGHNFLLPWGGLVNSSGTYTDTLHFSSGCDSIRRYVYLTVTPPVSINNNISICENENYTLPWGQIINQAGVYFDTVVTASGCDSLVRIYNLSIKPIPVISITKSNDINCVLGLAQINATGAAQYDWTPEIGLNNAHIDNPLAFPTNTTLYKLKATGSNGCTIKDSITIFVSFEDPSNAYLVPTAFTPNNDGLNDCFGVSHWGKVSEFSFSIFNRWGKRVFYTENVLDCWNGKFDGTMLDLGAYSYIIKAKGNCGKILRRGMVIMIR